MKYKVVHTTRVECCGEAEEIKRGEYWTEAVSEAKAISNVMRRLGYNQYNTFVPHSGDGCRTEIFEVEK